MLAENTSNNPLLSNGSAEAILASMALPGAAAPSSAPVKKKRPGHDEADASPCSLRLRGLPFPCTEQEVYAFFSKHDMVEFIADESTAVQFLTKANGKPSGQAIVRMRDEAQADYTVQVLNGQWMGSRYIEVLLHDGSSVEAPDASASTFGTDGNPVAITTSAIAASSVWVRIGTTGAPEHEPMESPSLGDTGGSGSMLVMDTPSPHHSPWGRGDDLQFETFIANGAAKQQAAVEAHAPCDGQGGGFNMGTGGNGSTGDASSWNAFFDFLKRDAGEADPSGGFVEGKPAEVFVNPL